MPIPKNEKFDLVKLLQRTIYLYNNHEQGDVSFETNLLVCPVVSDEQLMGRIISNLILNGLQSVTNDKLATIKVVLVAQDTTWLLTITDNGSGIPEEIRHKVFLPNFSTKYNGSGIGLAVAKRGVEHAGGKIWFETETNQGTTFFIELPKTDE
jgi:signal transduction histidine kinase